jgi:ABC-type polysaccharide/polyol phosphate transport system ATPase subunit/ABC-type polysaccharide/polyol phosphate export permease
MSRYRPAVPVGESAGIAAARRPQGVHEPAIRVQGVSKSFVVPRHRAWTLKERMRHPLASFGHDRFEALQDVSFDVAPGEFFAIIGRNGSGKSTLLRCIAGIYELDDGEVEVDARIAPFIELGVGFHPQLDAPDNVMVAGTMMGLRPGEARRRFPQVISFAELEEFADMPLATYSSGMQVRLAFSTSFQVDAEVLLFDEVLAVGDALFRRKCLDAFERLIAAGHTIVYVSHSLDTIEKFADRALLLERGRMVRIGEPQEVIEEYERLNRRREQLRTRIEESDGYAEIAGAWLESEDGARTSTVRRGERARFRFTARLLRDMDQPVLGFALRDEQGKVVLSETDSRAGRGRGPGRAGELQTFSGVLPSGIETGVYELVPLVAPPDHDGLFEVPGGNIEVHVEPPGALPTAEELRLRDSYKGEAARWWDVRRFADITLTLARTDFKLRYLDSAVGYVWALAQPLLMFAVLYVVWAEIVKVGSNAAHYELTLLLAIAVFTFFTEATAHSLPVLVSKGAMLKKIPFPPIALPLASVVTSAFVHGLGIMIVLGFILASGLTPAASWLELIPLLALLVGFTAGTAMMLSLIYVPVRDVQQIWMVIARLLFFLTPIFYPIEAAPQGLQQILMVNPIAVVIVQARHAVIDPSAPGALAAGGAPAIALSLAFSGALVAAGLYLYHTRARRLAERI